MPRSEGRTNGRWDSLAYLGLRMLPAIALVACASYKAAPLPTAVDWAQDLAALDVSPSQPLPEAMGFHAFDPSDGLDDMEVAMLAVANNSDLRARRTAVGVSEAQVFTAELLPDPQLSLTADFPMLVAAGTTTAFNLGLSYDWSALLARGSARRAAAAELRGARMSLLWQEWQVVNQARLLFVRIVQARRSGDLLDYRHALVRDRLDVAQRALRRGDLTLDAELAYRTALGDIERLRTELRRAAARSSPSATLSTR